MKPHALLLVLAVLATASVIHAAPVLPSHYKLDLDPSTGQLLTFNIPDDGSVLLTLIRTTSGETAPNQRFALALTPFHTPANAPVNANIVEPADPASIDPSATTIRVRLALPANLPAGNYTGGLVLSGPNVDPMIWKLQLVRPAPPPTVLVAAQQAVTIDLTQRLLGNRRWLYWGPGTSAQYTLELRGKNNSKPPTRIEWQQEQAPKAPDGQFDPGRSLDVKIQPEAKPGVAHAVITVRDLKPGEYTFYLRFTSPESAPDDLQKVTVTVHVRRSVWWAVGLLLLGLLFSVGTTRYVTFLRARAQLTDQITTLQRCWGTGNQSTLPSALAVAWARSTLEQARDLSRRFSFTTIDTLKGRLAAAERLIGTLDRIQELLTGTDALPRLQRYRARVEIHGLLQRMDPRSFSEATATQYQADITSLREWLDCEKGSKRYQTKVTEAYTTLVNDLTKASPALSDPAVAKLVGLCPGPATSFTDPEEVRRADENYCRLRILVQYHHWPEAFARLSAFEQQSPRPAMEEFFMLADDLGWDLLKHACAHGQVQVDTAVLGGSGVLEAYQPVLFRFSAYDTILNQLYVVNHGCEYHWKLSRTFTEHRARNLWRREERTKDCPPVQTNGPLWVDYPEGPGVLHVKLEIRRSGDVAPVAMPEPGNVQKSEAFKAIAIRELAEGISFGVSLVLALISGLATYYFKNPTFGTPQDMISLLLIAAGIDQSKNALLQLQSWKPGGETTTAAATTAGAAAGK